MSNVSNQPKEMSLLCQIPKGALPLSSCKYQQSKQIKIQEFRTEKYEFIFYFPEQGQVSHFPSNLSEQGDKVKAQASFHNLTVVEKRTVLKKESFRDVMMGGNEQEILEFLEKENIVTGEK